MRFFLGDPCLDGWLGRYRSSRLSRFCDTGRCAVHSLASGIPFVWLGPPSEEQRKGWGLLCKVFTKLLPAPIEIDTFCNGQLEVSRGLRGIDELR